LKVLSIFRVHQKRAVLLGLLIVAVPSFAPLHAELNINTDAIKKSVVFLYDVDSNGGFNPALELGTGFLVRVNIKGSSKAYMLLVTARHVIDPQWAKCRSSGYSHQYLPNPTLIYARLNKRGYVAGSGVEGTVNIPIPLVKNGERVWQRAADDTIDAAVLLIHSPETVLADADIGSIPLSNFPTENEVKSITIGDQLVSAGLVPGMSGKKRNSPFFKFGYVSSIPDEEVEVFCTREPYYVRGWFVAANLVAGNSGSPIFYVPAGGRGLVFGSIVTRPLLLGVQSSSIPPADLAVMTPIDYVYEIIQSMHLVDADLSRGEPARSEPESTSAVPSRR
jgi:hypothetical protein